MGYSKADIEFVTPQPAPTKTGQNGPVSDRRQQPAYEQHANHADTKNIGNLQRQTEKVMEHGSWQNSRHHKDL